MSGPYAWVLLKGRRGWHRVRNNAEYGVVTDEEHDQYLRFWQYTNFSRNLTFYQFDLYWVVLQDRTGWDTYQVLIDDIENVQELYEIKE